jgi:ribosomal protein S4
VTTQLCKRTATREPGLKWKQEYIKSKQLSRDLSVTAYHRGEEISHIYRVDYAKQRQTKQQSTFNGAKERI